MSHSRVRKLNIVIGSNIKRFRKQQDPKMSQGNLAKILKITRVSMVNIESGKHGLKMIHLIKVAATFNIPIGRFFKGYDYKGKN